MSTYGNIIFRRLGISRYEMLFLRQIWDGFFPGGFFFSKSRGKKKTVKSSFIEVGRRLYVITWKKKPTPFAITPNPSPLHI